MHWVPVIIIMEGLTYVAVMVKNTVVSWANAHSQVSAHVTVLAVRMESAPTPRQVPRKREPRLQH